MHDTYEQSRREIAAKAALIERAANQGVRAALLQHKRAGNPIVVWRDGQVVWVPAEEIPVEEGDDAAKNRV
jgi:hypothetical protein